MNKLPVLFLSHGSPMMALATAQSDPYVAVLRELGKNLPKPRAILAISAHWYVRGDFVDVSTHPETIYDFGGFPDALYQMKYPAPGFPEWADLIRQTLGDTSYTPVERGLDHGVWTTLVHLYPDADVPVFSVSLNASMSPKEHLDLGTRLQVLREQGILIIGMGNIVHNLMLLDFSQKSSALQFGLEFDVTFKWLVEEKKYDPLLDPWNLPGWKLSVPTLDHYLPALSVLGAADPGESVTWLYEGHEMGTISRRAFAFWL